MTKKLDDEDQKLWSLVAGQVKPLPPSNKFDNFKKRSLLRKKQLLQQAFEPFPLDNGMPLNLSTTAPLKPRPLSRKNQRAFTVDARLDLHGYTQAEAIQHLTGFIHHHYQAQNRNLLIITGKGVQGKGILKTGLPEWLVMPSLKDKILAVSEAASSHGGSGAYYVQLRRCKET